MTYQFKIGLSKKMAQVLFSPGKEIVQTQNVMALFYQAITKM